MHALLPRTGLIYGRCGGRVVVMYLPLHLDLACVVVHHLLHHVAELHSNSSGGVRRHMIRGVEWTLASLENQRTLPNYVYRE